MSGQQTIYLEPTCVNCGWTENMACVGGCEWVKFDPETKAGVCSQCAALVIDQQPKMIVAIDGLVHGMDGQPKQAHVFTCSECQGQVFVIISLEDEKTRRVVCESCGANFYLGERSESRIIIPGA